MPSDSPLATHSRMPGYVIGRELSSSAKSVLHAAFSGDDLVVIKSPKLRNATAIEFENLNSASHPCVIRLLDSFPTRAGRSLVLPYAAGSDLLQVSRADSGLDDQSLKVIARRVLLALTHIHSLKRMHRDIKPENILLMKEGSPDSAVLADLEAMSRIAAGGSRGEPFPGTASYAAPEIWSGGSYDEKIDIWALGITLYVARVRRFPFGGQPGSEEMVDEILEGLPRCWEERGFRSASDGFRELVEALLSVDPRERPSAEEALGFTWFGQLGRRRNAGEEEIGLMEGEMCVEGMSKWYFREKKPDEGDGRRKDSETKKR